MTSSPIRIGTRGSPLALAQANEVRRRLAAAHGDLAADGAVEIVVIRTSGDRLQQGTLAESGGKGLFTKEIEEALLAGSVDIAVHSMKDVPTWFPDGLVIDCVLPREDPRDALISAKAKRIADIAEGATVGTASLRRKAMLLHARPDLRVVNFRGNVDTRIAKLEAGEADATFLAMAGLNRLGRTGIGATPISADEMLPAVCQGIVGIERRQGDDRAADVLAALDHGETAVRAAAERALLAGLDGSCRTPIAALAEVSGGRLSLRAAIVRTDGSGLLATEREGQVADAAALGADAAEELRRRGGPGFFDEVPGP